MLKTAILLLLTAPPADDLAPADLASLYEPEPIGFSFAAPGWYGLGILLILVLVYLLSKFIMSYRRKAYRRAAVKTLNSLGREELADRDKIKEILLVLKLVAIKTYGREKVASLFGREWLKFLEDTGKTSNFTAFEPVISEMVYCEHEPTVELNQLMTMAKIWIRTHA